MKNQTINIGTEKVGSRVYITGNTYNVKDRIKSELGLSGSNFDRDRKQWWVGAEKAEAAEKLVGELNGQEAPKEDLSSKPLKGKAKYKNRSYYVLNETATRLHLTVLDGSIDFWADTAACQWEKRYQSREQHWRGKVVGTSHTTLNSIREFIEQQKNPDTRIGECTECGARGPAGESCRDCGGEGNYI